MKLLDKAVNSLLFVVINIIVWLMCSSVVLQVISRYIFNSPLSWTEEVARICMVWMTFLGGAYLIGVKKNGHIIVDALVAGLPDNLKKVSKAIGFIMMIVLSALFLVCGVQLIISSMAVKLTATRLPIAYLYASAPVSAVFMLYYEFKTIIELVFSSGRAERE